MNEDMVNIWIDQDEWYPVYKLRLEKGYFFARKNPITIPREQYVRIMKVFHKFDEVQKELKILEELAFMAGQKARGEEIK